MQSRIFSVKSNAARAAKPYGIKRDDLIAVSGGWCFNIPSETAPQSPTEPATAAVETTATEVAANVETPASEPAAQAATPAGWDKVETSTEDEPFEWAGVDYMVVNGVKPVELVEQAGEPIEVAPAKAKVERKRSRKSPSADKPESRRAPTKPAAKSKTGNQAPKEGKGASLIAALKKGWQPVPELLKTTGWLPHTLRGYITRTAKAEGWTLERDRVEGVTRYRIKV
jgi:Protein of unknown function (DUF3489)